MRLLRRSVRHAALAVGLLTCSTPVFAQTWFATLNGANEIPPVTSLGAGFFTFTLTGGNALRITGSFSGLTGNTSAAHIHCCSASANVGVATQTPTFSGFPLGVTFGSYDQTFDLTLASSFNPAFVTAQGSVANARNTLIAGFNAGTAYLNIHSGFAPGGEIRGFIATPEPSSVALIGFGLMGAGLIARRRRTV